jgi:hypothetical protein
LSPCDVGTHGPDRSGGLSRLRASRRRGRAGVEGRARQPFVILFAIGAALFAYALARFRATIGTMV